MAKELRGLCCAENRVLQRLDYWVAKIGMRMVDSKV